MTNAQELSFSIKLFREIVSSPSQGEMSNAVLCPGGVIRLLRALHAGSAGDTASEIATALALDPASSPGIKPEPLSPVMKVASAIWVDPGNPLTPAFQKSVARSLGANASEVPLLESPESARGSINKWVEENTGGNIKELLKAGDMRDARLVLTDAAWFNDAWAQAFNPQQSVTDDFTLADGSKRPVRYVAARRKASYAKSELGEVLLLPFSTARYQAMVLLPPLKDGENPGAALQGMQQSLNPSQLAALLNSQSQAEVEIRLPKLDLKGQETDLVPVLKGLGIKSAFGDDADFSPMCKQGAELKVGIFKQSAAFKLDEKGAEASAATVAVVTTKSAKPSDDSVVTFFANRPCLILVTDTESRTIPFIVRCAAPAVADGGASAPVKER